jgi:hypothetical protein
MPASDRYARLRRRRARSGTPQPVPGFPRPDAVPEAGQLYERVLGEFRNLDLPYGPGLTTVSTGAEAVAQAREQSRFGLIISALRRQR